MIVKARTTQLTIERETASKYREKKKSYRGKLVLVNLEINDYNLTKY